MYKNTDDFYQEENNNSEACSRQSRLFSVETLKEVNGIEMGVLDNGIPFLTELGLSKIAGINRSMLRRLSADWALEKTKPRGQKIQELLEERGCNEDYLFLYAIQNGEDINAYHEYACMAILEYYAFETDAPRKEAKSAYRIFSRAGFRSFIHSVTEYIPKTKHISEETQKDAAKSIIEAFKSIVIKSK